MIGDALGLQVSDVLIIEVVDGWVRLTPTRSEVIKHEA